MDAALKRSLKSQGQTRKVEAWLGKEGMHPAMLATVEKVFENTPLIKVRIGIGDAKERKQLAAELAGKTGAELVAVTGRNALIYRASPLG